MPTTPTIVLLGDLHTDTAFAAAVEDLQVMSGHGLLHRFWVVDVHGRTFDDRVEAERIELGRRERVALFRSLAEIADPGATRVVSVGSAALVGDGVAHLAMFTWEVVDRLRWFQPVGVPARSATVVFPDRIVESSDLTGLFDARHAANLVVPPEDRRADGTFAAPVSMHEPEIFAAHMAAELAAQVGIWRSMADAPIDDGEPGVMDGVDPKVHLARSYACSAVGPPLPLYDAVDPTQAYPTPAGVEASPAERESAARFADALFADLVPLHLREPEPFNPERAPKGALEAFRFWLRKIGEYLRDIPGILKRSLAVDFEASAGRFMTTALGDEAEVEVVWTGKGIAPDQRDPEGYVEAIVEGLEARVEQVSAPAVDQNAWTRVIRDVAAVMDAGPGAQTVLSADARQMVIAGVDRVGPAPDADHVEALDAVLGRSGEPMEPTMLGRFVGRAVGEERRAHATLADLVAGIRRLARLAKTGTITRRSFLTWGLGVLTAILVTSIVLAAEAHSLIRLDSWSPTLREIVGLFIAAAVVAVGLSTLSGVFVETEIDFSDQSVDEVDEAGETDGDGPDQEDGGPPAYEDSEGRGGPEVRAGEKDHTPASEAVVPDAPDMSSAGGASLPGQGAPRVAARHTHEDDSPQAGEASSDSGGGEDAASGTSSESEADRPSASETETADAAEGRADVEVEAEAPPQEPAKPATESKRERRAKRRAERRAERRNRPPWWRRLLAFLGRPFRFFAIGSGPMADRRRRAVRLAVLPLVIGIIVSIWARRQTFGTLVWRQFPPQELAIVAGVVLALIVALIIMVLQPREQSGHARRLTGTTLIVYCSVAVIGLLVRRGGWLESRAQAVVRDRCTTIAIVAAILIIAFFVRLVIIRVQERLQMVNAIKRLRWNSASARSIGEEIVRLRAVVSQLVGTVVAVNRILWLPFGQRPDLPEVDLAELERLQALKLQLVAFEPSDRDHVGIRARIRRVVAQRGWLFAQYDRAARAFLPELAFLDGLADADVGERRPEHDPSLVDTTTSEFHPGQGPRWRFAELLYDGAFDHDLAEAGFEALFAKGLDLYLGSPGSEDGVLERGRALVAGQPPRLQPEVLARVGILTGDDDRATYSTTLWWPAQLAEPAHDEAWDLRRSSVDHRDQTRMVVQFVRTDWSRPIPRGRLPIHDSGAGSKNGPDPGPEPAPAALV